MAPHAHSREMSTYSEVPLETERKQNTHMSEENQDKKENKDKEVHDLDPKKDPKGGGGGSKPVSGGGGGTVTPQPVPPLGS